MVQTRAILWKEDMKGFSDGGILRSELFCRMVSQMPAQFQDKNYITPFNSTIKTNKNITQMIANPSELAVRYSLS